MGLFKEAICEGQQVYTEDERALIYLGAMYCSMLEKYFKKSSRFPVHKNHLSYEKQMTQLKKFLGIIQELNIDPEQYMRAQFELLTPWIKKTGRGYLMFNMLISPKAKERWFEWLDRIDNQNELKKDKIQAQYSSVTTENLRPIIFRSIKNFYKIISWYIDRGELKDFHPVHFLEIAFKAGDVDAMYVYINPMIDAECKNEFLKDIWKTQDKKLSKKHKDWLQRLFEETRSVVKEKGVEKYV